MTAALRKFEGAVLVISHDRLFLEELEPTHIITVRGLMLHSLIANHSVFIGARITLTVLISTYASYIYIRTYIHYASLSHYFDPEI